MLDRIEAEARRLGLTRLYTEASITAEPLFRKRGFTVVRPQHAEVGGHTLRPFVIERVDL